MTTISPPFPQVPEAAEATAPPMSNTESGPVLLSIEGITVHFGTRLALQDIHTNLRAGEIVSIVGPNGAGKSTLLNVLAGLLKPSHGQIRVSAELGELLSATVYVPQRSGANWTFPVSVLDVVLMGAPRGPWYSRLLPYSRAQKEAARQVLKRVGMDAFATVQIGELSGGQQQRVFLARALMQEGRIFLLDEPFAGVDIPTQELLLEVLAELRAQGKTVVYATHDLAQASRLSNRMWLLNRTLIADGPPQAVMTPERLQTAFGGQVIIIAPPSTAMRATEMAGGE